MKLYDFLHQPNTDFEALTPEEVYEQDRLSHPNWPEWNHANQDDKGDYEQAVQTVNRMSGFGGAQ
jgi:hypothetical protein